MQTQSVSSPPPEGGRHIAADKRLRWNFDSAVLSLCSDLSGITGQLSVICRWGSSSLLNLLLILLIAVGPWMVVASQASGGCHVAATYGSRTAVQDCCDAYPEISSQQSCGDSYCSAGHCSPMSFVPSPDIPVHPSQPSADDSFLRRGFASHLSAPSTPPPIVPIA